MKATLGEQAGNCGPFGQVTEINPLAHAEQFDADWLVVFVLLSVLLPFRASMDRAE